MQQVADDVNRYGQRDRRKHLRDKHKQQEYLPSALIPDKSVSGRRRDEDGHGDA